MADRKFRVVVAGAGGAGLFMAETLKRAGIDFAVYEKAGDVGGTWRDNTFPGLFVDVLSRQYEFPFQPNYNWSRKYAPAWAGCDVTQFIRRAQWVHIRDNPHSTWRERLKLRLPGGYAREQRRLWQMINEGDRWRLQPGAQRDAMEREYASFLDYIKDPELRKKLTPDYNLGCTRIPKSDKNYYEAVQLPNAHILKGQIAHIVPDGVVMADGNQVKLDVLVYATGFDAHAYMRPMNVTGLNGTTIDE